MDGKNIADYVDPEIEAKLQALEEEEDRLIELAALEGADDDADMDDEDTLETAAHAARIREKKKLIVRQSRDAKGPNRPIVPRSKVIRRERTVEGLQRHLASVGVVTGADDLQNLKKRGRSTSPRRGLSQFRTDEQTEAQARSASRKRKEDMSGEEKKAAKLARARSKSAIRGESKSASRPRSRSVAGLRDEEMARKSDKLLKMQQRKRNLHGKVSESDRKIPLAKEKWMLTGKRGIGKTDRR
jgi:nucleolar GTP-binding protein